MLIPGGYLARSAVLGANQIQASADICGHLRNGLRHRWIRGGVCGQEGQDLGADSLDTFELVYAIEEEMGVEVPDEKANEFETVRDAIDFIKSQQS